MTDDKSTITVNANCPCGVRITWPSDAADDFIVVCDGCGKEIGTYGDLIAKMREAGIAEANRVVRETFKNLGHRKY